MSGCSSGCAGVATRGQGAGSSSRQSATMYLVSRRQAVTYGTPGRAAWLARSLARWLAGRLAGAAPGAGAWVWERAALSTYLPISIYLYLPTYLSSRARGRGDPTAVLAAHRFIKCLLPSGLSISSSTE